MNQLAERFKAAMVTVESNRDDYDPEIIDLFFRFYRAYIRFTEVYAEFDREKNIDNWMKAHKAVTDVLNVVRGKDENELKINEKLLRKVLNQMWGTNEFNDIYQNKWIYDELDRLNAPAFERESPYNYIKRREEEERRKQEEERRKQEEERRKQEEERQKQEEKQRIEEQRLEKYATPPAAGGSKNRMKLENKSKKHSKQSKKSKSRRHSKKSRRH